MFIDKHNHSLLCSTFSYERKKGFVLQAECRGLSLMVLGVHKEAWRVKQLEKTTEHFRATSEHILEVAEQRKLQYKREREREREGEGEGDRQTDR